MRTFTAAIVFHHLAIGLCLLCIFAPAVLAQESGGTVIEAADSASPLGMTVEQVYGEVLRYDFGVLEGGRHFLLDVTFRPGEVYWHELWKDGNTETDPTETVLLDEHRMLSSWPEENGWFVVMYADFLSGETSFCGTRGTGKDASRMCLTGTISREG